MVIGWLFDGCATGPVYAIAGVTRAALWGAITGLLALVPFLGYVAVTALALQLAMTSAATPAIASFGLGCVVLFCGDKIVRPLVAGEGTTCALSGSSWRASADSRCLALWGW